MAVCCISIDIRQGAPQLLALTELCALLSDYLTRVIYLSSYALHSKTCPVQACEPQNNRGLNNRAQRPLKPPPQTAAGLSIIRDNK